MLALALGVLAWLFKKVWGTMATRADLELFKQTIVALDRDQDAEMAEALKKEIASVKEQTLILHAENIREQEQQNQMLAEIRNNIIILLRRHGD